MNAKTVSIVTSPAVAASIRDQVRGLRFIDDLGGGLDGSGSKEKPGKDKGEDR